VKSVVGFTKSDKEFLAECPKGYWFGEDEMILWRRYRYRLSRLAVAGVAEWRGVGTREYRVTSNSATSNK